MYYLETFKKFRSRIASYSYGPDIIRNYLRSKSQVGNEKTRRETNKWLLTNPTTPDELEKFVYVSHEIILFCGL